MDRRLCFVVVLVLAAISSWRCSAKDLAAADHKRDVFSEKQVQVSGNEDLCLQCKQLFAIYSDKQKQSEMIDDLHNYCSRFFDLAQMCIALYEPILTSIFDRINSSTPESFCKFFCEGVDPISQQSARNWFSNMPLRF
ncbi:PREDICTED: uncharacterized protein LOC109157713 [Ipomoea nil]|uniref:uncharacterized protein LOC109157713 n=1 Tax=Ipomoea nil TaxID=35883 RepID=UPI000900E77D|nr:PREDICTED: uncharacterized protein LOC109157713 [Ipomoea nil]